MMKREPDPGVLSTSTVPPCAVTMAWTRARPSPAPPASRVLHHDVGLAVASEQREAHLAPRRRVLYGVVHQVLEGPAEAPRLAEDGHRLDLLGAHVDARALRTAGADLEGLEHERLEIDAIARDTHGRGGAREEQEILGEPGQVFHLLEAGAENATIFFGRALGAEGDFDLTLERGEGRAQLVRRVGGEATRLGEGSLEAGEHGVEGIREMIDLVLGAATAEPTPQVLRGDLACRAGHVAHRVESAAGGHEAARRRQAAAGAPPPAPG